MPSKDRVRRDDRAHAPEQSATELLALRCEAATLVARETEPSTAELLLEDAVLLDHVVDLAMFLAADPPARRQEKCAEREAVRKRDGTISALTASSVPRPTGRTPRGS